MGMSYGRMSSDVILNYWHKFGYWRDFRDLSSFDSSCPRVEIRRERAVEARIYKNQNSLLRSSLFVVTEGEIEFAIRESRI
jgi:hypothetical protein